MAEAKDIYNINNIVDMLRIMASLGVSCEGLQSLDEMKHRVIENLKTSEKKSSWTAKEAFSVLTEAKKEDERKRETLHRFFEDTDVCLGSMDEKVRSLLEQNLGNLKDKIAINKRNLKQKEYIVLVAGETSSGKSTMLNLILGEQLLPYHILSTTSTICELKYGTTRKLVAHFKDKDPETGLTEKTVLLGQSMETSQQSYLDEISSFVHVKTNREKGSDYKKIELFWPHSLLEQGIVIVDSPGIGESAIMDEMVKEYLPEAFAFIYVINCANAGGIQKERLEKLIEHARNVALDQLRESSSSRALFVCNKWDQVQPREADDVRKYIIKKLTQCWPSLDPESQIIYMSSTNASEAQGLGVITNEFAGLMNGIKAMVLKSIEARLQTHWRKLNYPLIVKFYGAALRKEGDQERAILVMELCKENLMSHIFRNPKNIPGMPSSTSPTDRNTIRWAKDIANALRFVHRQGFVHRDLKLENILITHACVVKIADVGVSKEAKMVTGTMTGFPAYVAPEVIKSRVYDSKADIYSFGIIMWEMWYGKKAVLDVRGDLNTFLQEKAEGVKPPHVEGMRKPPDGWQNLMQWCWDDRADKRPTAVKCHSVLSKLYQEAVSPI